MFSTRTQSRDRALNTSYKKENKWAIRILVQQSHRVFKIGYYKYYNSIYLCAKMYIFKFFVMLKLV